jgi:hypothetical protein
MNNQNYWYMFLIWSCLGSYVGVIVLFFPVVWSPISSSVYDLEAFWRHTESIFVIFLYFPFTLNILGSCIISSFNILSVYYSLSMVSKITSVLFQFV